MIRRWLYLILILATVLAGCATGPKPSAPPTLGDAEQLINQGQYDEAAQLLRKLATQAPAEEQNRLLLRAVSAMARADKTLQARQLLNSIDVNTLNEKQYFLYKLTQAHLALAERNPDAVLSALILTPPDSVASNLKAEYHQLRAESYSMLGHRLESARERVRREAYLHDPQQIKQNQYAIWEALALFSERALQQLRTDPAPDTLSGWMEIVELAKAYQLDPVTLTARINDWRDRYPQHPILDEILANLQNRRQEDVVIPNHIAVLLPLSSKFAKAAEAVRDGFVAAYYSHPQHAQQRVRILDTGSTAEQISSTYQQAINEGAEFVVGPLDKNAIEILAKQSEISVPTLSLNYGLDDNIPGNLYQFGLSPEEEARQVAERTWLDGHVNAVVLVPQGPWGERVYQAFAERWQQVGGKVVELQQYDATQSDFSRPIKKLMNIDESQR
ncbi:MAG: penicillin-binding protein activator, partial [Thioalkalispiraceae bacterium]